MTGKVRWAFALLFTVAMAGLGLSGVVDSPEAGASPEADGVLLVDPGATFPHQATLFDAANGSVADSHNFATPPTAAVWAPSGERIAVFDGTTVTVYDYPGWTVVNSITPTLVPTFGAVSTPAFDAAGSRLAYEVCDYQDNSCELHVFDVASGTDALVGSFTTTVQPWLIWAAPSVDWVGSGPTERIATAETGGVRTWDPATGTAGPWVWETPDVSPRAISLSPDRTKLATFTGNTLVVLDVDAGFTSATNAVEPLASLLPSGVLAVIIDPSWAPDSRRFTVTVGPEYDTGAGAYIYDYAGTYTLKADGSDRHQISDGKGIRQGLAWSGFGTGFACPGYPGLGPFSPPSTYSDAGTDHYVQSIARWSRDPGRDEVTMVTLDATYEPCDPDTHVSPAWTAEVKVTTADPVTSAEGNLLTSAIGLDPATPPMFSVVPRPVAPAAPDTTPPTVSCDAVPSGWQASNVSLHCTASDSGSGLADAGDASFDLTTSVPADVENPGAMTDVRYVCDNAANCVHAGPLGPVQIDRKAPTINVTLPAEGQDFFQGALVDPVVNCTDGGSGLAVHDGCTYPATIDTASTGTQLFFVMSFDQVGNPSSLHVNYHVMAPPDTTPPTVTCDAAPSGWQAVNVLLHCTASDSESGLADAGDASFDLTTSVAAGSEDPAAMTGSNEVCDNAGNCATAGPLGPIQVDRKAPAGSCPAAPSVWNADNVTLSCTVTDAGSGPASQSVSLSTSVAAGVETAAASTGSASMCDAVGNCVPAGPIGGIKVDRKAPVVSCPTPLPGWNTSNVTLVCHGTDGGSGPASQSVTLSTHFPGGETSTAFTDSGSLCDAVGNCATAGPVGPIEIDTLAPTVACPAAPSLWNASNVTLSCIGYDGGSGPASQSVSLSTSVAAGVETATASTGSASLCDAAGNCATAGPISPIKVDRKSPTITVTTPTSGQHVSQGATVSSAVSCTDAGSGVPVGGCSYPATLDTATTGTKTFHVAAVDLAGNTASTDVSYVVDPVAAGGDWVSVAFSGNTTYSNARSATSSNVAIAKYSNGKIKSIYGTMTIPSKVSGNASVVFQLNCGLPGLCSGSVTVTDTAAGFYRQTPAFFAAVNPVTGPNPVPGAPSPYVKAAQARLPWFGWTLTFTVDDRA